LQRRLDAWRHSGGHGDQPSSDLAQLDVAGLRDLAQHRCLVHINSDGEILSQKFIDAAGAEQVVFTRLPNADLLLACGMSSVFAVPITVDGEVRYVIELFSSKIALPDSELLQVLGSISSQLGHLVERKLAEEALRRSDSAEPWR